MSERDTHLDKATDGGGMNSDTTHGGPAEADARPRGRPGVGDLSDRWRDLCQRLLGRFFAEWVTGPLAASTVFLALGLWTWSLGMVGLAALLAAVTVGPSVYQERRWRDERRGNPVYSPLVEFWRGRE